MSSPISETPEQSDRGWGIGGSLQRSTTLWRSPNLLAAIVRCRPDCMVAEMDVSNLVGKIVRVAVTPIV